MRGCRSCSGRRRLLSLLASFALLLCSGQQTLAEPLPSWNDGPARAAILSFVSSVTTPSSPSFVPVEQRIATFDMDGTLWVEQPIYPEVDFAYDRLASRAAEDTALAQSEPFKSILARGRSKLHSLDGKDIDALLDFAMSGMTVEAFRSEVQTWLGSARQSCWNVAPTKLFYQPMRELMAYFKANGFKNYIVTGSSQDFARSIAADALGMSPQEVVGSSRLTRFEDDGSGEPELIVDADVILDVGGPGKPEAIHLFIGQRPIAAFGNSRGDADMLEYATSAKGARLGMLVLHDDGAREYAYGPAQGLPNAGVGVFDQALFDRARNEGWHVISMRKDWRDVFTGVSKVSAATSPTACALP